MTALYPCFVSAETSTPASSCLEMAAIWTMTVAAVVLGASTAAGALSAGAAGFGGATVAAGAGVGGSAGLLTAAEGFGAGNGFPIGLRMGPLGPGMYSYWVDCAA